MVLAAVLQWIWSWCTVTTAIVYFMICFIPVAYIMSVKKQFVGTPELNKKYAAFARHDVENWTWTRLLGNNILLLFPIRFLICWGIGLFFAAFISVAMFGRDLEKPLPKWFENFFRYA